MADRAYPKRTMPDVVAAAGRQWGDKEAIVAGDRRITFAQLADQVRRTAAALVRIGMQPGDRVAIWAPNSIDWIIALFGIHYAGGVLVPVNTRYKGEEAAFILGRSKARFLFTVERFLGTDYPAMLKGQDLPLLERTILLPWAPEGGVGNFDAFIASATGETLAEADHRLADLGEDAVSDIMFTSGTTGEPKGVVTCHGQNVQTYEAWLKATGLRHEDRLVSIWPLFHCAGYKSTLLSCMMVGATLYQQVVLDADELMALIEAEKITFLPGPPTLFQTLLAQPGAEQRFRSLRVGSIGAATIPPSVVDEIRERMGVSRVITGYGLTESCGTVSMSEEGDSAEILVATSGRPVEGVLVKIVDDDGNEVPIGEAGEIMVGGYTVMQGYLDDPEATRAVITADGWLHTGDVGALTETGHVRITDRKKDMYIVGGFNAYPAEIEKLLLRHEAIADVAVKGVPDERLGEVGKAWIVPVEGAAPTPEEIIKWARTVMANYKVPRYVELRDALPKTPSGKVQKFLL